VVSAKAKTKIKDALKEEKRVIAEDGKYALLRKLESIGAAATQGNIDELVLYYKQNSALELFYKIAVKQIDLKELKKFRVIGEKLNVPKTEKLVIENIAADTKQNHFPKKDSELIIFGESSDKIMYTLAKCCNPIPGDDVFGFVSTGKGLVIHRINCPNAAQMMANYEHRIVKVKWAKNKEISFLTGMQIIGVDDVGVINKITNVISGEMKVNISALSIESQEGVFKGIVKVFVHDKDELNELVERLKQLDGIQTVDRLDV
jgi:GTP pyrophosphokinase